MHIQCLQVDCSIYVPSQEYRNGRREFVREKGCWRMKDLVECVRSVLGDTIPVGKKHKP